ncbi:cholesterol catabolism transcriptional regulator KstR [Pseudonocardia humida]|uniref:Cholesterol catabolism transcriptional regulator KstR n=1 Tax=Pseudonocardia humida TaxID=2800819 RepID=A0ABT0ZXM0_9PSEU|nr:cholesterol catabolism transcriptional regulator KstR [Pseudonocardia humida]MCO1655494.1 cholesterol catabolism transcriptional regulator KstR [Pseudonocardia humida]
MAERAHRSPATPRPVVPLSEVEEGSPAQRERRRRILEATLALATKGGFDAVQMRAVAERAGVALGTLYRYFPSKVHLLVAGLAHELSRVLERIERAPVPGATAAERVLLVLHRNTVALQRDPHLTEAMTRAFMFADTSVAEEVRQVSRLTERMLTHAMGVEEASDEDKDIARVIGDVWLSNLVAWVTRRASAEDVENRLALTVRLLLSARDR